MIDLLRDNFFCAVRTIIALLKLLILPTFKYKKRGLLQRTRVILELVPNSEVQLDLLKIVTILLETWDFHNFFVDYLIPFKVISIIICTIKT